MNLNSVKSDRELMEHIANRLDFLCDNLVPSSKEQITSALTECSKTEPDWLQEIAKYVGNCYTVPADSYLFGRKVLAFKIVGYSTLSPLKGGTQKISVIELWREGSTGCIGSSVNVSMASYTFTIRTNPEAIYDDFMLFMSDFCEIDLLTFNELIADTIKEV